MNPVVGILKLVAKIASLILYLVTIVAAFGGHVSPHLWSVPSMITLFFPYLFIATFVAGVAWLISKKYIPAILAGATLMLCYPMSMDATPLSWSKSPKQGDNCFTLMTYNAMGMMDQENPDRENQYLRPLQYLIDSKADVICLQEVYSIPARHKMSDAVNNLTDSLYKLYPFIINGSSTDITILSKYPVVAGKLNSDQLRRCRLYHLRINGERVDILSVHLASYQFSNDDKNIVSDINSVHTAKHSLSEFKHKVSHKLSTAFKARAEEADIIREVADSLKGNVIICGDFNDVPCSWTYRTIKGDDFSDAYSKTGFGPLVTYNSHAFYFHIDQVLYRGDLEALNLIKDNIKSSDHYPLIATFRFNNK
jgi:endonuclease/exonuclease/phosphatase family metal-dependent hydrolase